MKKYLTIKLMLAALAVCFSASVHAQESESWPVNELSMAGSTSWWVYSSNLPDELKVGSEIIISETGTGLDGLVCEVTELASNNPNAFKIESGSVNSADVTGLNGTWSFAPAGGQEALATFEANWDDEEEPEGTYMTGGAAVSEGDDDPHLHRPRQDRDPR